MCVIPLDLERRFEQRWAARFSRPVEPAAHQKHRLETQCQPASPGKRKRKTRRVESTGLRPAV
jgi:hypothetical protein